MKTELDNTLDIFLKKEEKENKDDKRNENVYIVDTQNEILERINKKILTEDGKELLYD